MSTSWLPFLILPIPTEIPVGFGIYSTSGPEGVFIQCRGLVSEREYIKKAAECIGMTYGGFQRRVMTDAATAVLHLTNQLPDKPILPQGTHRTEED